MKIRSGNKKTSLKHKQGMDSQTRSFADTIIVHDPVLVDIEEQPGTRGIEGALLSAKGEFIYEIDFEVQSEVALYESITAVDVVFYKKFPGKTAVSNKSSAASIKSEIESSKTRRHAIPSTPTEATTDDLNKYGEIARARVKLGDDFLEAEALKEKLRQANISVNNLKNMAPKQRVSIKTAQKKADARIKNVVLPPLSFQ